MARVTALDLYCCAGGMSRGFQLAGFHVTGVDLHPQPKYIGDAFIQADVLTLTPEFLRGFDFVHASPPCQAYSWAARRWKNVKRADLVAPTRALLTASGVPFSIENVVGAPIRCDVYLTGPMFGLSVIRRRHFELSFAVLQPPEPPRKGTVRDGTYVTVAGHGGDNQKGRGSRAAKQAAMGISWMDDKSLNEAIPPAYGLWIGRRALAHIEALSVVQ